MADSPSEKVVDVQRRFKRKIVNSFSLRGHMMIILACTAFSGFSYSALFHALGWTSMVSRYPCAVFLSYGTFFLLVKVWLDVIFPSHTGPTHGSSYWWNWPTPMSDPYPTNDPPGFRGQGGKSGGGGAAIFAIFGSAIYLIWTCPEFLSEAAFQFALSAGLIRPAKKAVSGSWEGTIFMETAMPFLVVLGMAFLFGGIAQSVYPHATTVWEVLRAHAAQVNH